MTMTMGGAKAPPNYALTRKHGPVEQAFRVTKSNEFLLMDSYTSWVKNKPPYTLVDIFNTISKKFAIK